MNAHDPMLARTEERQAVRGFRLRERTAAILGIVCFALMIAVPPVVGMFRDNDIETLERRKAAAFPGLPQSSRQFRRWPRRVDTFLNDHLGWRDEMILANGSLRYALGTSAARTEVARADNVVFRLSSDILEQYRGTRRYRRGTVLNRTADDIARIGDLAAEWGGTFLMTVAPNKITVYGPEDAPKWLNGSVVQRSAQLRQMSRAMRKRLGENFIGSLATLNRWKDIGPLYSAYGTHWDELGAFFSYDRIMQRIAALDPSARPYELDRFVVRRTQTNHDTGNARVMGLMNVLLNDYAFVKPRKRNAKLEEAWRVIKRRTGAESQSYRYVNPSCSECPSLLVLGDSFSLRWHSMFPESFREVVFMHHQRGRFDPNEVRRFKPDFVLLELVEQQLARKWHPPKLD